MKTTGAWTRRQFGQAVAATAASAGVPGWARALVPSGAQTLAFVSLAAGNEGAIHTMRIAGGKLVPLGSMPGASPGRLLLHPSLPVLYAFHDVALWDCLPRGAVSAYRIGSQNGTLTHINTQPLSLAATHPYDGTVFLNGTALFVMTRAGIYNVLQLANDGSVQPVCAIRKVMGDAGPAVRLANDGETLVIPSEHESFAFRFTQDGGGAQIVRVEEGRASLLRTLPHGERSGMTSVHRRLAAAYPGLQGMALYKI